MATTTATITVNSTDLLTDELSLSASATLTNAGVSTGVTQCSGLSRKTITYSGSGVIDTSVIYRADDYTANGANKIYIKNISTTAAEYFSVYITGDRAGETHSDVDGLTEICRLYAGDWMWMPWDSDVVAVGAGGSAIEIQAYVAEATIEYCLFHNVETKLTSDDS